MINKSHIIIYLILISLSVMLLKMLPLAFIIFTIVIFQGAYCIIDEIKKFELFR